MQRQEGFITVTGGKVWYEIVGDKKNTPLLIIHGGPGYPHDYLEPLEELAKDRHVIFYDQLGCGNSERPTDVSLWTLERSVNELETVIASLGLKQFHLLGHSWGAAPAIVYAHSQPKGLEKLILSDPLVSTPLWEKDAQKLLHAMPQHMQEILQGENNDSPEYKEAFKEFYYQHVYRLREHPVALQKAEDKFNNDMYNFMWGPSEFEALGTLKHLDLTPYLPEITIPTLLVCGRFDEATPQTCEYFKGLLPHSQLEIFELSAHFPFWTEREKYLSIVRNFLRVNE